MYFPKVGTNLIHIRKRNRRDDERGVALVWVAVGATMVLSLGFGAFYLSSQTSVRQYAVDLQEILEMVFIGYTLDTDMAVTINTGSDGTQQIVDAAGPVSRGLHATLGSDSTDRWTSRIAVFSFPWTYRDPAGAAIPHATLITATVPQKYYCTAEDAPVSATDANTVSNPGGWIAPGFSAASATSLLRNKCIEVADGIKVQGCAIRDNLGSPSGMICTGVQVHMQDDTPTGKITILSECNCSPHVKRKKKRMALAFMVSSSSSSSGGSSSSSASSSSSTGETTSSGRPCTNFSCNSSSSGGVISDPTRPPTGVDTDHDKDDVLDGRPPSGNSSSSGGVIVDDEDVNPPCTTCEGKPTDDDISGWAQTGGNGQDLTLGESDLGPQDGCGAHCNNPDLEHIVDGGGLADADGGGGSSSFGQTSSGGV